MTIYGYVSVYGNIKPETPHVVSGMPTGETARMADDRRGLLTPREREILSGVAEVDDSYYYAVVSRVRTKIQKLGEDSEILRENHADLYSEFQAAVSGDPADESARKNSE